MSYTVSHLCRLKEVEKVDNKDQKSVLEDP